MTTETKYETYYVPEQSKLAIFMAASMCWMVVGLGRWIAVEGSGPLMFMSGFAMFAIILGAWFTIVVKENVAGMNSAQLKRSFVWGMGWFIFSEVMFFAAFFGALWYIRNISIPHLSDDTTGALLWGGFSGEWPLMTTPDMTVNGDKAVMRGPGQNMSNPGVSNWFGWLPFWNTSVLLLSSVLVHFAHVCLNKGNKKWFNIWLGLTVLCGIVFLFLQVEEYIHAYHVGLTLETGVYGATFFMLTGFHGLHVTMGTFILLVMFLRSVFKGHFKHGDCFGFEAASWYWHFVDVVWLGLFLFVYIF